jgi:hypothetical protein
MGVHPGAPVHSPHDRGPHAQPYADGHAYRDACWDADADRLTDHHPYTNGHAHTNHHPYTDDHPYADQHADRYPDPNADRDAHTEQHTDVYPDAHADADANPHLDAFAQPDVHIHPYTYAQPYAYRDVDDGPIPAAGSIGHAAYVSVTGGTGKQGNQAASPSTIRSARQPHPNATA